MAEMSCKCDAFFICSISGLSLIMKYKEINNLVILRIFGKQCCLQSSAEIKGTVMQIDKTLLHDHLSVSKVS